jgi:peptide/nickel transport system substrate-binding protein
MHIGLRRIAAGIALLAMQFEGCSAMAQRQGGNLRIYILDSPPTMSIHEEAIQSSQSAMAGVFNNLPVFDQHEKQSRLDTILPDLATGWNWNDDGTALTLPLRQGVKWHDGKPFTAKDVLCTWDLLLETGSDELRFNPRKTSFRNLERVTASGDHVLFRRS